MHGGSFRNSLFVTCHEGSKAIDMGGADTAGAQSTNSAKVCHSGAVNRRGKNKSEVPAIERTSSQTFQSFKAAEFTARFAAPIRSRNSIADAQQVLPLSKLALEAQALGA
jgi:hypothetical protein